MAYGLFAAVMKRDYQYRYSTTGRSLYDEEARGRKARTMVAVLGDCLGERLGSLTLLNVGASTGIMDSILADHFKLVAGIDIDDTAIAHAGDNYRKPNLSFQVADALDLPFAGESFDVAVCSQVYEHVPDARRMFDEIYRVLVPGGVCYLTANNRLRLMEPHYRLPLLSVMPRRWAHRYLRITGKGSFYYERHASWWGLRSLVGKFERIDYSLRVAAHPAAFHAEYLIPAHGIRNAAARFVLRYLPWASPGYIWVLRKPAKDYVPG